MILSEHTRDHARLGLPQELDKIRRMITGSRGQNSIDHSLLMNLDYASAGHTGFLQDTTDVIKDTHVDWGTGANQVSAVDMPIADTADYFTGTEVETALTELTPRKNWNQNGFPTKSTSTISFTDGTNTFSIQPTGVNFQYFVAGIEYTSTGDTVVIDDTKEGIHAIYYDGSTLTATANPSAGDFDTYIRTKCLVSILYWDTSASEAIYVGEERHGYGMSPNTHNYLHFTVGLAYLSGIGLNTLSVDGGGATADAQFGVDAGSVSDEDLHLSISAVAAGTGLPIYYMLGSTPEWQKHTEAGFSVRTLDGTSGTRLAYNQYVAPDWQLTDVGNNDFVLCHIFATTEKDNPMIAIMGQNKYTTKKNARAGALTEIHSLLLDDVLFPEIRAIATVIFQTNTGYASEVNARVVSTDEGDDYIDWRSEVISRTEISTTDHSSLSGLSSDDHTQYLLADGSRALAGAWDMGSQALTNVNIDTGDIATAVTNTEWDTAYSHIGESGASHTYIDQDVTSGSTPTFTGTNFTGLLASAMEDKFLRNDGDDTTSGKLTATGGFSTPDDVSVNADNKGLILGAGQDSKLYFDGTDTKFDTTGSFEVTNTDNTPIVARGESAAGNVAMQIYNDSAANVANTITYSMNLKTTVGNKTCGVIRSGFTDITDATRSSFMDLYTIISGTSGVRIRIGDDGGVFMYNLKTGTDQADAGAATDECYVNTVNQTIRLGV